MSGNGDDNSDEGVGESEPGNLRRDNRGESQAGRRGATPTSNQQSQSTRRPSGTVASC